MGYPFARIPEGESRGPGLHSRTALDFGTFRTVSEQVAEHRTKEAERQVVRSAMVPSVGSLIPIKRYTYLDYDNPGTNYFNASPLYAADGALGGHAAGTKLIVVEFPSSIRMSTAVSPVQWLMLMARFDLEAQLTQTGSGATTFDIDAQVQAKLITAWNGLTLETLTYSNYTTLGLSLLSGNTSFKGKGIRSGSTSNTLSANVSKGTNEGSRVSSFPIGSNAIQVPVFGAVIEMGITKQTSTPWNPTTVDIGLLTMYTDLVLQQGAPILAFLTSP